MAFAITPSEVTPDNDGEAFTRIVSAVREYRDAAAASASANDWVVTASAGPFGTADALWDGLVRTNVLPSLGAEFIALSARKHRRPHPATAGTLQWPAGVEGPATVAELMAQYPATFKGIDPGQVSAVVVSPTWQDTFARHMTSAVNLVKGMPDSAFRDMQARLLAVADDGIFEKQRIIREFLSWDDEGGYAGWMRRAERIARTEIQAARQAAAYAAALAEVEDGRPMKKIWHTSRDERVRPEHAEVHGQERPLDAAFDVGGERLDYPGDREHGSAWNTINCVVGSTRVAGPGQSISASYRRPTTGRFFEFTLANGRVLTVTPNHPILTDRGYFPAERLREGYRVMATPNVGVPDVDDVPPRADQAHDSMRRLGSSARMGTTGLDFHGDAAEGEEVEIVTTHGVLPDDVRAAFRGDPRKHLLVGTGDGQASLAGGSARSGRAQVPVGVPGRGAAGGPGTAGLVSGGGEGLPLGGGHARHSDSVGLGGRPDGEADPSKVPGDDIPRYPETAAHLKDAFALGMEPTKIVGIEVYTARHDVYNLTTSKGYYIANGVMVHNCRCGVSYVADTYDADDYPDLHDMDDSELEAYMDSLLADGGVEKAPHPRWEGKLAPLGTPTGDGRLFAPDGRFRFREFPIPLLWQETTGDGHDASRIVGAITGGTITRDGVTGEGFVFSDEEKVLALLQDGLIRPSVDLCDVVTDLDDDGTLVLHEGTVMAATLVATPAFEDVNITLTGEQESVAASLVASGALDTLPTFPAAAFTPPAFTAPHPVTIDRSTGHVTGHLALWDSCHVGLPGRCVQPPRSATGYAAFHQSTAVTDDGERLAVGRLTVGGGHADARAGVRAAAEHYDTTGACWAFVRAGEDEFGIWVAGVVNPAATREQLAAAEAAPLSGDWRRVGASLELVAALSVSTPGFPVRREFAADEGVVDTLVAAASPVQRCGDDNNPDPDGGGGPDAFERGVALGLKVADLDRRFQAFEAARRRRDMAMLDARMGY